MNTWLLRSAALVTGEKLRRIFAGHSSLTHATPGFGPQLQLTYCGLCDDVARQRQHSIGLWKFRLTISTPSR